MRQILVPSDLLADSADRDWQLPRLQEWCNRVAPGTEIVFPAGFHSIGNLTLGPHRWIAGQHHHLTNLEGTIQLSGDNAGVRDLTISAEGFRRHAIDLSGDNTIGARIERVRVTGSDDIGICTTGRSDVTAVDVVTSDCRRGGFVAFGATRARRYRLRDVRGLDIKDAPGVDFGPGGIVLGRVDDLAIEDCRVTDSDWGIVTEHCTGQRLEDNVVERCEGSYRLSEADVMLAGESLYHDARVIGNQARETRRWSAYTVRGQGVRLRDNLAAGGEGHGYDLSAAASHNGVGYRTGWIDLRDNHASEMRGDGLALLVYGSAVPATSMIEITAKGNRFTRNRHGVQVWLSSPDLAGQVDAATIQIAGNDLRDNRDGPSATMVPGIVIS